MAKRKINVKSYDRKLPKNSAEKHGVHGKVVHVKSHNRNINVRHIKPVLERRRIPMSSPELPWEEKEDFEEDKDDEDEDEDVLEAAVRDGHDPDTYYDPDEYFDFDYINSVYPTLAEAAKMDFSGIHKGGVIPDSAMSDWHVSNEIDLDDAEEFLKSIKGKNVGEIMKKYEIGDDILIGNFEKDDDAFMVFSAGYAEFRNKIEEVDKKARSASNALDPYY